MKLLTHSYPQERCLQQNGGRGLSAGFTLIELLMSALIGVLIMISVISVLGLGVGGYQKMVSSGTETLDRSLAAEMIRTDLSQRHPDLPLSLGKGEGDGTREEGWDFLKGGFIPWSSTVSYGAVFPSEIGSDFPSDRIGFFTFLPEELSEDYGGHNIAHVLYFTALTRDYDERSGQPMSEDLTPSYTASDHGYSRKLFRYFTPPDRVYERLKILKQIEEGGGDPLWGIPRGPIFVGSGVTPDDASFSYARADLTPSTLSTVAEGVAQFSVIMSGVLRKPETSITITDIHSNALTGEGVSAAEVNLTSLDRILCEKEALPETRLVLTQLQFCLKLVPSPAIPSLQAGQWDFSPSEEDGAIGRKGLRPVGKIFTVNLEN